MSTNYFAKINFFVNIFSHMVVCNSFNSFKKLILKNHMNNSLNDLLYRVYSQEYGRIGIGQVMQLLALSFFHKYKTITELFCEKLHN